MEARKPDYFSDLPKPFKENLEKKGFYIISLPLEAQKKSRYRHIAINLKQKLGEGNSAFVYQAYPINPENGQLEEKRKFKLAAKIFKKNDDFEQQEILKEAKRFNQFYRVDAVVELDSQSLNLPKSKKETSIFDWPSPDEDDEDQTKLCMLMEYLPGKEIAQQNKLDKDIAKLNLTQRIRMLYQIALATNNMHHETVTKPAITHGDIKGENLRFFIGELDEEKEKENKKKKEANVPVEDKIHVYIADFGFSRPVDQDPNAPFVASNNAGTAPYLPYEWFYKDWGIKSDIPALVPLFALILGAKNPLAFKENLHMTDSNYRSVGYDFHDIYKNLKPEQYPLNLFKYTYAFLDRMQECIYQSRADIDEALRFFSLLDKFCKICDAKAKQGEMTHDELKKLFMFTDDDQIKESIKKTQDPNLKNILETKRDDLEKSSLEEYLTLQQISYIKTYLKNIEEENFNNFLTVTQAKLILLATGLWYSAATDDKPKRESTRSEKFANFFKSKPKKIEEPSNQLAHLDLDANISFCKEIIKQEPNLAFKDEKTIMTTEQMEDLNHNVLKELQIYLQHQTAPQVKKP